MGNIQIVARGPKWIVIQRGNLDDLSAHLTLDEAIDAAHDIASRNGAKFIAPNIGGSVQTL
jgi:hypothetical protein